MARKARLAETAHVRAFLRELNEAGCYTTLDRSSGTAEAFDGDKVAFRALQKGKEQPWICMFTDTPRVTWKWPDDGVPKCT